MARIRAQGTEGGYVSAPVPGTGAEAGGPTDTRLEPPGLGTHRPHHNDGQSTLEDEWSVRATRPRQSQRR